MDFRAIEIIRGAGEHRAVLPKDERDAILAGSAPLMTGDNVRFDMIEPSIPEGTPKSAFAYRCLYNGEEDITFDGSLTDEKPGKHWHAGGQAIKNLQKSHGNVVNLKLGTGAQGGHNTAEVELTYDGETASVKFSRVD